MPARRALTDTQWFCRNLPQMLPADGCWEWQGALLKGGYGTIALTRTGRVTTAHRFAYSRFVAEPVKGMHIDHLCRNRRCVNPAHLEMVTAQENILRGEGIPAQNAKKTHCKRGHALTPENIYAGWKYRTCKICMRKKLNAAYAKRKASRG